MSEPNTQITSGEGGEEQWHLDRRYVYRNDYGAVGYVDGPGSNPGLRAVVKVYGEDAEETAARIHAALAAPAAKGGVEAMRAALAPFADAWRACVEIGEQGAGYVQDDQDAWVSGDKSGGAYPLFKFGDLHRAAEVLAASPPPPAGAAGGGSGDLAALSAGAVKKDFSRQDWFKCEFAAAELRRAGHDQSADAVLKAALIADAPTPDLGAQGEPVAWAWEELENDGEWVRRAWASRPDKTARRRNIRPLYEAPAAPRSGSTEELRRRVAIILNDTFDAAPHRIGIAADAIVKEAAIQGAPRSGSAVTKQDIVRIIRNEVSAATTGYDRTWLEGEEDAAEKILAILQAPRHGETGDGWEPIETAPKDVEMFLLACANWPHSTVLGKPVPIKVGGWHHNEGYWQIFGASWEPTHWRPLPAPPVPSQPHNAQSTASAGDRADG